MHECQLAFIGGSSTLSINIPEDLNLPFVKVLEENLRYETPWGMSPEFKLISINAAEGERSVLTCRMHGWRSGVSRADASRQVFWVLKQAGVKRVVVEGGVGAINHLLNLRDVVIPHDYIDYSVRKDVGLDDHYLLIMRDSICPVMSLKLTKIFENNWEGRVFNRGVYVNTDGRHFESPAEINVYRMNGGDIVGQSICPEVYLAREIGACYAGVYMVVNYAEGIIAPWQHEDLADIFYNESKAMGKLIFNFLQQIDLQSTCSCKDLRKETLLKDIY
ncbi:MAG: MTAP family purine nucleoside phosphorylase [Syntrophomonadaceae bacterium]|nr:MTAP family purine nucleoside phosphorylase [Syntrophomonadaceae bacterium]